MERIQNLLPGGVAVRDRFGIWMKAATTRLAYVRLGAVFCLPILDDLDAVTSWTLGHSTSRSRFSSHYPLIKPGPIDTPWPINARSYLEDEPQHVPPVYAPETVARAILHAAVTPTREVYVGGGARWMAASGQLAPGLTERLMAALVIPRTHSHRPPLPPERHILYHPSEQLQERGDYPGMVQPVSVYTEAVTRRGWLGAGLLGAGLAAALWQQARRRATARLS